MTAKKLPPSHWKPVLARYDLEPRGDPGKVPCAITMDFRVLVSGQMRDMEKLGEVLQRAVDQVLADCKKLKRDAYLHTGVVRPTVHEELLQLIPRKKHYATGQPWKQVCNTPYVAKKNLTQDDSKVTCKLCKKIRGLA